MNCGYSGYFLVFKILVQLLMISLLAMAIFLLIKNKKLKGGKK